MIVHLSFIRKISPSSHISNIHVYIALIVLSLLVNPTVATSQSTTMGLPSQNRITTMGLPFQNRTVTIRLANLKYNDDYANKTSPFYKSFSKNVTDALKDVYSRLSGFESVEILELTCNNEVIVEHKVITRSETPPDLVLVQAYLRIANLKGFLRNKITNFHKPCETQSDNDSNNWVYMIVFVCVVALLLLIMVSMWRNFI